MYAQIMKNAPKGCQNGIRNRENINLNAGATKTLEFDPKGAGRHPGTEIAYSYLYVLNMCMPLFLYVFTVEICFGGCYL